MGDDLVDFSGCERNEFRAYGGASGNKINITYEGKGYMLKFPPKPKTLGGLEFDNSCVTEYLACHIFESLGFDAQETILGTYTDETGTMRDVVACRDFTGEGQTLIEFAHLKNTCLNDRLDGYSTDLGSILTAIEEQRLVDPVRLRKFFWAQFVGDALLANYDRHNGNWGIIANEEQRTADIAPVYDCGSCLFPQLSEDGMGKVLGDPDEIYERVRLFPKSTLMIDGARIDYYDYIVSGESPGCDDAVSRVCANVDMDSISGIVWDAPGLSETEREFYVTMIGARKEGILDPALERISRVGSARGGRRGPRRRSPALCRSPARNRRGLCPGCTWVSTSRPSARRAGLSRTAA